ncbi:MAG TPA: hypothetical protein DCO83_17765 [Mucilaginibacter sp.]|jgi:hypothetical protein|nr:hypothetical protein [Mucilaginibacter sp.]
MKLLFNLIRAAIYLVAVYYLCFFAIIGFNYFAAISYNSAMWLEVRLGGFFFWFTMFFIGFAVLSMLWWIFKIVVGFIMSWIARICTYRTFAIWSVGLISAGYSIFFLIGFWFGGETLSAIPIIVGLMLTIGCIQLCTILVKATIIGYETMDEVEWKLREEDYRSLEK